MSDFLGTLAARSLGSAPSIRPRAVSLFEPETAAWEGPAGEEVAAETVHAEANVASPPSAPAEGPPESAVAALQPTEGALPRAPLGSVPARTDRIGGQNADDFDSEPPAAPIPKRGMRKSGAPIPAVQPPGAAESESAPGDAAEIRRSSVGGRIEIRAEPEPAGAAAGPAFPRAARPLAAPGSGVPADGVLSGERPVPAASRGNEPARISRPPPADILKTGPRIEAAIPEDAKPPREEAAPVLARAFDPGGGERLPADPPAASPGPAERPEDARTAPPAAAAKPGPSRKSDRVDAVPDVMPHFRPESTPTVHVTIGRIEVRAVVPPETHRPAAGGTAEKRRVMSLDEYLKQRTGKR